MDRYSISKDVLTNKRLFQSLIVVILVVKYVNGCSSEQYLVPRGYAVRMYYPIAWSQGYDTLVWKYQIYNEWITFVTCRPNWQECTREYLHYLHVQNPYFDIFQTFSNSTTVSVLIDIKAIPFNISCMANNYYSERLSCEWHILATKNILTFRHTTAMSTSTMRSTTNELSNVCLLSESGASVNYMSVSRQGPFNVSVSALNYHYTDWLVCARQRARNVGQCLPSSSGSTWCFDSFGSDNPDFKSRLETRGSNFFLVFERIKSNISELQVLCVQNTTHFKNRMLWKIYISDTDDNQLSHQTTHDYDLKDHYEDSILPIIIVVPTSVLTLLVIIICTVRRRRSSASRRASSAPRAALGNRGRVTSPAVSSPQNDQVSLWLTTISARLQHAPAPRNGANPPPYDEPPPYDSLSLTEFHATDISVRTISIVHDGVSESNDSDPPPPYPGV